MNVPLSWLKDFVAIDLPVEQLAHLLTVAGLEVEGLRYVGIPASDHNRYDFKITRGVVWEPARVVVAEVRVIHAHPFAAAERLVICEVYDGVMVHQVITGGANLAALKGRTLERPIKVALAREGAAYQDPHGKGKALTVVASRDLYGVLSSAMICSEYELEISDNQQDVMMLEGDVPVGMPLAELLGDVVLEIKIEANQGRNANMLGIAREISAQIGRPLRKPQSELPTAGASILGQVDLTITVPDLNQRFMLGLARGVQIGPSPAWVQRRLHLAGLRPVNNVVDATNYAMLEVGEPLHAFDWDKLVRRARGMPVRLHTRPGRDGEVLAALDEKEYELSPLNVLVCDEQGPLSIAGVIGGIETSVDDSTTNVLVEAAAWDFINIRRTAKALNVQTEASFRFIRGVHPELVAEGLQRGLHWIAAWCGGQIAPGLVDAYPQPPADPMVLVTTVDVQRWLGIVLSAKQVASFLERLEFGCQVQGDQVAVTTPPFRLDIGQGISGVADIMEEIARIYGLDNLPEQQMAEAFPTLSLRAQERQKCEDRVRDILVSLGFQEIVTYRMTRPDIEHKLLPYAPPDPKASFVWIANSKSSSERSVLRRSLLSSVITVLERNAPLAESLAMFEVGPVFLSRGQELPLETRRMALAMTGRRWPAAWDNSDKVRFDFFDMKGVVEALMRALYIPVAFTPTEHVSFHPAKCVAVKVNDTCLGELGELHPLVQEHFDFGAPVVVADFDLDAILDLAAARFDLRFISKYIPLREAVSFVVDEALPAARAEAVILAAGIPQLIRPRLADVYRGAQAGPGKKSLTFELTYESIEPLQPEAVAEIRARVMQQLERELGAQVRA